MQIIWPVMMLLSTIYLCFTNPNNFLNAIMLAGEKGTTLCINLLGIYAIWLGILQIVADCGLNQKLASLLSPIIDFLFGKISKQSKKYIALNLSTNILGMGNACTPMGLKAMQELNIENKNSKLASYPMIMLVILNVTSIQLIPTTILGLRETYHSQNASSIILPTLITTSFTTILGIIGVKICNILLHKRKHDFK